MNECNNLSASAHQPANRHNVAAAAAEVTRAPATAPLGRLSSAPIWPIGLPDFSTKSRQQRVKRNPNFESTKCSTTAATHSRRSPEMRPPPTVARAPRATANSSPIGAMPPNMATASGSPSATPANATSPVIAGRALQL